MLRGLTKAGLGSFADDKQFIELASEYSFQSVDLDAKDLIEVYGLIGAKEILQVNNIHLGAIGLPVEWRSSHEEFTKDLVNLASAAKAAQDLGCTRCCTYILPSTDVKSAQFMSLAVKRLRICAEILGSYDVRLGLEYVGPHHLRNTWKNPFIWTQEETLQLIDAIGLPNVGLLLDSYHWYTTGLSSEDLSNLNEQQIVHVHINDAADLPVEGLKDNDRLYTGEGVIDLHLFLKSIKETGYSGPISQEVLTPEQPSESGEELIKRSKIGFDKVFNNI
ncbi:sugar phosphate isomerase/epimerase family protein [Metabacillus halosaccharovorans]|uniref:sugar phosphate isomerase/epimerase family protein n=1 Tax=Metabacillus halosaccharovorans TaxID=930124 RepID=UPI00203D0104|nr:sugar phosphate isomerase/epimerase family protein [Metabacillus halosaccharovorans]MCM3439730.1 sugar phosphate isomerase/epimerase [Metabacillus halosaccharovorans]